VLIVGINGDKYIAAMLPKVDITTEISKSNDNILYLPSGFSMIKINNGKHMLPQWYYYYSWHQTDFFFFLFSFFFLYKVIQLVGVIDSSSGLRLLEDQMNLIFLYMAGLRLPEDQMNLIFLYMATWERLLVMLLLNTIFR